MTSEISADERFRHWIDEVSRFWNFRTGVLMRIRAGDFDLSGMRSFIDLLAAIEVSDDDCIPRRLVSLLWEVPTYISWQAERVEERGGDLVQLRDVIQESQSQLERILGSPCAGDSYARRLPTSFKPDFKHWIKELNRLWQDPKVGFCRITDGVFDPRQTSRSLSILARIDEQLIACFPRRFLTLVWDLPAYLERNVERVIEGGGSVEVLGRDAVRIRNELERLLGAP